MNTCNTKEMIPDSKEQLCQKNTRETDNITSTCSVPSPSLERVVKTAKIFHKIAEQDHFCFNLGELLLSW